MAVAVKNKATSTSTGLFNNLAVTVVMGVVYVLGSIGIVFPLLDVVWWRWLQLPRTTVWWSLLIGAGVALAVVLLWVGRQMLGGRPATGVRAGIALGAIWTLAVALLTLWFAGWLENYLYATRWFGPSDRLAGLILTGALALILMGAGFQFLTRRNAEKTLGGLEQQGWFSTNAYKKGQGVRVRRGTVIGVLILALSGVYSLHRSLQTEARDWIVDLPFTGAVMAPVGQMQEYPDAFREELRLRAEQARLAEGDAPPTTAPIDRFDLRDRNAALAGTRKVITKPGYVGLERPGGAESFEKGQVVSGKVFEEENQAREDFLKGQKEDKVDKAAWAEPAEAEDAPVVGGNPGGNKAGDAGLVYARLLLLPGIQYSIPLLLAVLTLWFAWRIVNLPAFADFLIATEAEMNKVSWATRKQLTQDTIVVLVTVLLMTAFLLTADVVWSQLLKGIGVLQAGSANTDSQAGPQELPW